MNRDYVLTRKLFLSRSHLCIYVYFLCASCIGLVVGGSLASRDDCSSGGSLALRHDSSSGCLGFFWMGSLVDSKGGWSVELSNVT